MMTDKPECKYGTGCYRKNEEHLKKFRHPKKRVSEEEKKDVTSSPKHQKMTEDKHEETKQSTSRVEQDLDEAQPLSQDPSSQEENSNEGNEEVAATPPGLSIKEELKAKFKVEMPQDFFDFWDYCKSINPSDPCEALKDDLCLELGGPFDVMARKLRPVKGQRPSYLLHHRFFFDPPEFQTVLLGDKRSQHHFGYYRDEPNCVPVFVASNSVSEGCTITPQGENLFAAIKLHTERLAKQTKDKDRLESLRKREKSLTEWAKKCSHSLEARTKNMKAREKKVVTKTFHKAGIVVPLDSTGVGYRELPETDGTLKKILKKIVESDVEQEKTRCMDSLQEIITLVQFANDECDYGQGYELGIDLFSFGHERFHSTVGMLLSVAYQLLGREEFGEILEAHLKKRSRDNVSKILS